MTTARPGQPARESSVDADLVAQVRQGSERAFEALVRRHLAAAHTCAYAILREDADADDVCQDAFIIALRRVDQCRAPERFRAWLLAIVRNEAIEMVRQRGRRGDVNLSSVLERSDPSDPTREMHRAELRSDLREAIQTLTELQRRVFLLHDLDGLRHREIANELGITPGSSRVHLHVARRAMRKALQDRYSEA